MTESTTSNPPLGRWARLAIPAGALAGAGMLLVPPPQGLSAAGWRTAAVATLMAIWWITEAIPIPATALVPLVAFPALGVLSTSDAAAPYANEIVFLFMGGFLIAVSLEQWGLHRRLALGLIRRVGTSPRRLVLGFMLATAFLSMWISNTATAAMMFPIAMAVAQMFRKPGEEPYHFGIALMLGVAWAASIGGVATLIGTPPNAVLAANAQELLGRQIGFMEWMAVGLPIAVVLLPVAWALLVYVLHRPAVLGGDAQGILSEEQRRLGPMSRGEKTVAVVFVLTALAWIFREPKSLGSLRLPGIESFAPGVGDATIAMAASLLLFLLPVDWKAGRFALEWSEAKRIPWGVLLLFGGGLSLARAMERSGLAAWIGGAVAGLGGLPDPLLIAIVAALFMALTEVTSNTATSAMAMPVMAGAAPALGLPPLVLMSTAALASSMAFMLPVATPPNAIVFGSEYLTVPRMARAGLLLNVGVILLLSWVCTVLVPAMLL